MARIEARIPRRIKGIEIARAMRVRVDRTTRTRLGTGKQAQGQAEVGDDDARRAPALELGHAGPQHRGPAADDDGKQVGERAEEHLQGEADDEDRRQGPVVVGQGGPRPAGRERPGHEAEPDRQPDRPAPADRVGKVAGALPRAAVTSGR